MKPLLVTLSVSCLALTAACGDDETSPGGPEPAECAAGWKLLHAPGQTTFPSLPEGVRWQDGRVFYASHGASISGLAVDVITSSQGAAQRLIVPGGVRSWWVEGDQLTFLTSVDSKLSVTSLPIAGGALTTEMTSDFSEGFNLREGPFALTPDTVLTVSPKDGVVSLVRIDRATGAAQAVGAPLRTEDPVTGIRRSFFAPNVDVWGDWVFFSGLDMNASFSRTPGIAPVEMPKFPGSIFGPLGVSARGEVLWSHTRMGHPEQYEFGLSRIGSSEVPRVWATNLGPGFAPTRAWDDGGEGWYVAGLERLADGALHTSIWHLGGAGRIGRLACDPEVGRYIDQGAVSPEGLVVAASAQDLEYYTELAVIAGPPSGTLRP